MGGTNTSKPNKEAHYHYVIKLFTYYHKHWRKMEHEPGYVHSSLLAYSSNMVQYLQDQRQRDIQYKACILGACWVDPGIFHCFQNNLHPCIFLEEVFFHLQRGGWWQSRMPKWDGRSSWLVAVSFKRGSGINTGCDSWPINTSSKGSSVYYSFQYARDQGLVQAPRPNAGRREK